MPKAHAISSANKEKKQYGVGFITLPKQTLYAPHEEFLLSAPMPYGEACRAEVKSDDHHFR